MPAADHPKLFTAPRSVEKRETDRVYFGWMQIAESKTTPARCALRGHGGAPVSTPLQWEEVNPKLLPSQFTIRTAPPGFTKKEHLKLEKLLKR